MYESQLWFHKFWGGSKTKSVASNASEQEQFPSSEKCGAVLYHNVSVDALNFLRWITGISAILWSGTVTGTRGKALSLSAKSPFNYIRLLLL